MSGLIESLNIYWITHDSESETKALMSIVKEIVNDALIMKRSIDNNHITITSTFFMEKFGTAPIEFIESKLAKLQNVYRIINSTYENQRNNRY